ncbi:uncharacterized protein [Chelonus insularis]|uniref:uncharacterized protein n=1 Tax=Chelonus insularis TaxID=460826 RepID=UPI00158B90A3|nr:uncharacterized protein LOC118067056 [Chelonus insularis]
MYKYCMLLSMAIVLTQCQRPPYAGSSNRIPAVLPQYLPPSQSTVASASSIDNRINGDDMISSISPQSSNIPADAQRDIQYINTIKNWPREKQPFDYLNRQHIEQHRGGSGFRSNRPAIMSSQQPFLINYF